ncbi:hypothetical protein [uncultured Fibrella sp.]|uniref:hypothetical protein n=1 Tax=uncultured Fibrella sp. TaxID=1284596 RepID=UPI0035C9AF7A
MALRISLLSIAAMLVFLHGQAQDTIPLYSDVLAKQKRSLRPEVGLDVYQSLWFIGSAFSKDSPATYAYPISVTLYLPTNRIGNQERSVYINTGYVAYGGTSQRNIYQTGSSIHIRAGIELTRRQLILGYGGLVTGWSGQGSFYFKGPTFGNYQEPIGTLKGLAVAAEAHIGVELPLGSRLSLRSVLRSSLFYRPTTSAYDLFAPHLSGIDWQIQKQLGMGISLQANLIFRL